MPMINRICLYGGPGSGKSTTAARVFSELKERGYSIEHCSEYVKRLVYQKRNLNKHDQVYIFGKQQQMEYSYLANGVKLIITDSPCFLSYFYAKKHNEDSRMYKGIKMLLDVYEEDFPGMHLFLDRGDKAYNPNGRYQTEKQAWEIDNQMRKLLHETYPNVVDVNYSDKKQILETILHGLTDRNKW